MKLWLYSVVVCFLIKKPTDRIRLAIIGFCSFFKKIGALAGKSVLKFNFAIS